MAVKESGWILEASGKGKSKKENETAMTTVNA